MTQFVQLETSILKSKDLNSDDKIALALLIDRMKSSVKREKQFFDKNYNDYYVIYTITEMMNDLSLSKGTTVKIFKKLEKLGYIIKRKFFNKATRLFIPQFTDNPQEDLKSSNFEPSKVQNLDSNHTNLNHNNTYDTYDTETDIEKQNVTSFSKEIKYDELQVLSQTLIRTAALPESVVNILRAYSFGDADKMYKYAGMIFKAKNFAKKQAEKTLGAAYQAFRFESNQSINDALMAQLKTIIINANKKADNKSGYIMRSLINLFEEEANRYLISY